MYKTLKENILKRGEKPMNNNEMLTKYLNYIENLTNQLTNHVSSDIPKSEVMLQVTNGLIEAIENYSEEQNGKFETYALTTIRKKIINKVNTL